MPKGIWRAGAKSKVSHSKGRQPSTQQQNHQTFNDLGNYPHCARLMAARGHHEAPTALLCKSLSTYQASNIYSSVPCTAQSARHWFFCWALLTKIPRQLFRQLCVTLDFWDFNVKIHPSSCIYHPSSAYSVQLARFQIPMWMEILRVTQVRWDCSKLLQATRQDPEGDVTCEECLLLRRLAWILKSLQFGQTG